jgi:hypothetical protein
MMKLIRRDNYVTYATLLIPALVAIVLLFYSSPAEAATETTINSLDISNSNIIAGESFDVDVDVDAKNAVIESGDILWLSETGHEMHGDLKRDSKSGKLHATVTASKYAEPGKWLCVWIGFLDEDGNFSSSGNDIDLSAADIVIENEEPDVTAPKFLWIKVSPKIAKPGDMVSVTIMAKDDLSGLDYGFVSWSQGMWSFSCDLAFNEKKRVLEGKVLVPDEAEEGIIDVSGLDIGDIAGNSFTYDSESQSAGDEESEISGDEDTGTPNIDLTEGSLLIKGCVAKELLTPPIIISPAGSVPAPVEIIDQDLKTPGIQFDVQGLCVPQYKVRLMSSGKVLAETTADFTGLWKVRITTHRPLANLYAVSVLTNGVTSPAYNTVTRAQIAKLLVKISGYFLDSEFNNAYTDVPASNPYVHYIETAKEIGVDELQSREQFKPAETISREEVAGWVMSIYESMQETDEAISIGTGSSDSFTFKRYFTDVLQQTPNSTAIERGYENGWLGGNPDKTFRPGDPISASLAIKGIPDIAMTDVPENSWYAGYMFDLAAAGIIEGNGSDRYRPSESLTRGEFAKMLCAMKDWNPSSVEASVTANSNASHWAYPYMIILQNKGVVEGPPDISELDKPITRAETAKMAVLAADFKPDTTPEVNFDTIGHWAEQYILTAKKHSIMNGYPDNMFRPDALITRAEASKIIWKMRP